MPQPPDGAVRGCSSSGHHRGEVCDAWKGRGITTFPEIREFLMNWHKDHPDSNRKPCTFVQPPDGVLRGCGAPHHKGRVCGSWAEHGILSRQDALNKLREDKGDTKVKLFKSRSDAEKLCNLPQPPDGRVIGCGEPFHRMNVCDSWVAFGVPNREGVKVPGLVRALSRSAACNGALVRRMWTSIAVIMASLGLWREYAVRFNHLMGALRVAVSDGIVVLALPGRSTLSTCSVTPFHSNHTLL